MCSKTSVAAICFLALVCIFLPMNGMAQSSSRSQVVVFWENGFPSADFPQISSSQGNELFSDYEIASFDELSSRLETARVLVLPFGSSFPEDRWAAIYRFLMRGGNLVVLGGRPFTRPAFRTADGHWQLRPETQAFARELRIYGYQPTSGVGLAFEANRNLVGPVLPSFSWGSAWSLVVRLSETSMDEREGSAGSLDADLRALAWGVSEGRKLSAPAVEIDHTRSAFVGSRWELLTCDPGPGFWASNGTKTVAETLINRALAGASEFRVQPQYAVFAPGEPWRFELNWYRPGAGPQPVRLELTFESEGAKQRTERLEFTPTQLPFEIGFEIKPSPGAKGLQRVTARLFEGNRLSAIQRTGFWMRDDELLRSGPAVSKDANFFLIDGKPQPIVGTTYMASDVQRQYFEFPNPYVWDSDMSQISAAGMNMLRTGWWTGWNRLTENGVASEKSLRAMEAYLLTARKYGLPVQFTFFAFIPEVLGGQNPYLDAAAVAGQEKLIGSVVTRFRDVPYLVWDIINEPSFSNPKRTWITRPNGDSVELLAWNNWLLRHYRSRNEIAEAWHTTPVPSDQFVPLPSDADFSGRGTMAGASPARAYDYQVFAQESFAAWAEKMKAAIRGAGGNQLVTIGQDEGGVTDRPLASYFAPAVDFTTNHTWWLNDALLWDSLAAKQSGWPLLIQETGIQHQANLDGTPRLTDQQESFLFERKLATALATSSGAIQWLWNTNAYMMPDMELTIGALRPDGTEKPEADVLRRYATFTRQSADFFRDPVPPEIVVIQSLASQLSPYGAYTIAAQQRSIRALHYNLHLSASVLAENQIDKLGSPKLVILPSPQALTQIAWDHLLAYVRSGGHLLVTGPVERDEHWSRVKRIASLSRETKAEPLVSHYSELQIGNDRIPLRFDVAAQQQLERLSLPQFIVDIPLGSGHVYVTADPVELANGSDATVRLYHQIAQALNLKPAYTLKMDTHSILIRATEMRDAVLYLFVSESAHPQSVTLTDAKTGVELALELTAGRARLAMIRKSDHKVIWSPE